MSRFLRMVRVVEGAASDVVGDGFGALLDTARQVPGWAWSAAAALLLVAVIRWLRRVLPARTDPVRLFTPQERQLMFTAAGGRCEHKPPLWRRCRAAAAHGDHVYPWSRGGATALSNGQALCQQHNLAKGRRVPSRLYRWRLARRRTRYFPAHLDRRVRWRQHRAE